MSGNHVWPELFAHYDCLDYRVKKNCRLCDSCLFEFLVTAVEHYICYAEAKYLIGLVEILFCNGAVLI